MREQNQELSQAVVSAAGLQGGIFSNMQIRRKEVVLLLTDAQIERLDILLSLDLEFDLTKLSDFATVAGSNSMIIKSFSAMAREYKKLALASGYDKKKVADHAFDLQMLLPVFSDHHPTVMG